MRFELLKPTTLWWATWGDDGPGVHEQAPRGADTIRLHHVWVYTTEALMFWWEQRPHWGFLMAEGGFFSVGDDILGTAEQNPDIIRMVET